LVGYNVAYDVKVVYDGTGVQFLITKDCVGDFISECPNFKVFFVGVSGRSGVVIAARGFAAARCFTAAAGSFVIAAAAYCEADNHEHC
jgi:hypothetical protein